MPLEYALVFGLLSAVGTIFGITIAATNLRRMQSADDKASSATLATIETSLTGIGKQLTSVQSDITSLRLEVRDDIAALRMEDREQRDRIIKMETIIGFDAKRDIRAGDN